MKDHSLKGRNELAASLLLFFLLSFRLKAIMRDRGFTRRLNTVPGVPGDAAQLLDLERHRDEGHVLVIGLAVPVAVEALSLAQQLGVFQELPGAAARGVAVVHVLGRNEGRGGDGLAPPRVLVLL